MAYPRAAGLRIPAGDGLAVIVAGVGDGWVGVRPGVLAGPGAPGVHAATTKTIIVAAAGGDVLRIKGLSLHWEVTI